MILGLFSIKNMFLALVIGILTLLIVGDYLRKRRHNEIFKKNGINSMPSLPIVGVAHHLINQTPAGKKK